MTDKFPALLAMVPIRAIHTAMSGPESKQQSPTQEFATAFSAVNPHLACASKTKAQSPAPASLHIESPLMESFTVFPDNVSELPSSVQAAESHRTSPHTTSRAAALREESGLSRWVTAQGHPLHKQPSSSSSPSCFASLLRRIRRSRFVAVFMAERVVKEDLVLPPPIHRVYHFLGESQHAKAASLPRTTAPAPTATEAAAISPFPRGDVYSFIFTRREAAQLRARQRRYFHDQHASPHAPQLVRLEDVAERVLHEWEIDGTAPAATTMTTARTADAGGYVMDAADSTTTTSERVAELLGVFCTRGIPQDEFIDAVFHFRMGVLQKKHKAVPVGVVVPSLVQPEVRLREAVETRQCWRDEKTTAADERSVTSEPSVTYPHPGRPYTFEDLARDPVQLSAEQRLERRMALLHRRTLSEDLYGTPTPYM